MYADANSILLKIVCFRGEINELLNYKTNKEALTVLSSVVKHLGSG